jgi:hypothetical protein
MDFLCKFVVVFLPSLWIHESVVRLLVARQGFGVREGNLSISLLLLVFGSGEENGQDRRGIYGREEEIG